MMDDWEAGCIMAEMAAERRRRLARERDYAETGYLGPCDGCGGDNCECDEHGDGDDECA